MNTWTGPQSALPPPAAVDELGENTRGWLAGVQQEARADVQKAISEALRQQAGVRAQPAPGHARRGFRFWPRRRQPVTGTRTSLVAAPAARAPQADDPTVGYIDIRQLENGTRHEADIPDPDVQTFPDAADDALEWGPWDSAPGQMRPSPVLILAADLTELPAFREAMAMRTRNRATECLCGDELAGQTWGERVMREGIHMLSVWDLPVVRMLAALPPAAVEVRQERAA